MLSNGFLKRVSDFINIRHLLDKDGKYIVALSGGADSVTLALTLCDLGYNIEAAHCNFHLRGDESDRDENFCIDFCKENSIELHRVHFDTVSYAKLRKVSIEMAARNLRYSYFAQLKNDISADAICVAHHQDDSVETVLMNLIRGTGVDGLTGISPKNGDIVRPLLCVSRNDIEHELHVAGQDYVTDSTNLVDDVVRNKIRLDILPLMRKINPSVGSSIAKTAMRMEEVAKVFNSTISEAANHALVYNCNNKAKISLAQLSSGPSPENVLFHILKTYSFTPFQIEQIYLSLNSGPGTEFRSSTHDLLIDREYIFIEPLDDTEHKPFVIPETGTYIVYGESSKFKVEVIDNNPDTKISRDRNCLFADFSKVGFPIIIRNSKNGDRFVPFGMNGSKLVSDYLTDRKFNLFEKRRQLILTDSEDRILWIVNQRPDNRCRVSQSTKQILKITYTGE